jgi:aspartate kinase
VVGVASERDVLVVQAFLPSTERKGRLSTEREGFSRAINSPEGLALLALLDEHRVAGKQLHVAADRLTLVVSRENLHAEASVRNALADRFGSAVRVDDALGALSVVGAGINASFENLRRGSNALMASGVSIAGIATSSFRITWMIDRARLDESVRLLHRTFIGVSPEP